MKAWTSTGVTVVRTRSGAWRVTVRIDRVIVISEVHADKAYASAIAVRIFTEVSSCDSAS